MKRELLYLASGVVFAAISISATAGTCRYPGGDEESCNRNQILPNTVYVPDKGEAPLSAAELEAQRQLQLERQRQEALAMEEQRRRALMLQRPEVLPAPAANPGQLASMCATSFGSCGVPARMMVGTKCWCMDVGSTTMSGVASP
jgi:hypothetical protein